jgi:hypothetical protein
MSYFCLVWQKYFLPHVKMMQQELTKYHHTPRALQAHDQFLPELYIMPIGFIVHGKKAIEINFYFACSKTISHTFSARISSK